MTEARRAPLRIAVVGASGKMGRAVVRLAREAGIDVVGALAGGAADVGRDVGEIAGIGAIGVAVVRTAEAIAAARPDVVVDFSSPEGARDAAAACVACGAALVSGTTGLDAAARAAIDAASARVAVLWAPNTSVGVQVLGDLVARAAALLGDAFDVEVVEAHHRAKVDAPSGTAARLVDVVTRARAGSLAISHGREGRPGPRAAAEIGVHAVRGGDVVGDHTVLFLGDGERIEITHRATTRDLFARGALRAARWIAGRPAGRYEMADVVGTAQKTPDTSAPP